MVTQLGALKMIKILFKILVLYIAYLFFRHGYLIYIGEAKCTANHFSTSCPQFARTVSAIMNFIVGLFLSFLVVKSIYASMTYKEPKLAKRGKYCWSEDDKGNPYCCKCYYEQNRIIKLISIDGKYYCSKCDYTTIYFLSKGVNDKSIDSFLEATQKHVESEHLINR